MELSRAEVHLRKRLDHLVALQRHSFFAAVVFGLRYRPEINDNTAEKLRRVLDEVSRDLADYGVELGVS